MSLPVKIDTKEPLIRDLQNEEDFDKVLDELLVIIYMKIGLKPDNYPSKHEKFNEFMLLINHIKTNYRTIRLQEIVIAFEMALKGRFKIDTQHYQNFSCEYFSRIMNAYLEWKIPFSRQQTKKIEKPKTLNVDFLLKKYNETLKGEYQFNGMELAFYLQLEDAGIEIISLEDKKSLFNELKDQIPKRQREHKEDYLKRVKVACKKQAFKNWIMSNVMEENDLKLIINKLKQ